jgi:hypothetical protein
MRTGPKRGAWEAWGRKIIDEKTSDAIASFKI